MASAEQSRENCGLANLVDQANCSGKRQPRIVRARLDYLYFLGTHFRGDSGTFYPKNRGSTTEQSLVQRTPYMVDK